VNQVIRIIFGYIDDPGATQKIKKGTFDLVGCSVGDELPKWMCRESEERFGTIDWV
jgi:hypothetical protein